MGEKNKHHNQMMSETPPIEFSLEDSEEGELNLNSEGVYSESEDLDSDYGVERN